MKYIYSDIIPEDDTMSLEDMLMLASVAQVL
jgi:hypothetical protein